MAEYVHRHQRPDHRPGGAVDACTVAQFRAAGQPVAQRSRVDAEGGCFAFGEVRLRAVKPCPRCPIPNIDPQTGISSPEVGDALQVYRRNARVKGAASFGMNLVLLHGQSQVLRIGQQVTANYRFDD